MLLLSLFVFSLFFIVHGQALSEEAIEFPNHQVGTVVPVNKLGLDQR